MEHRCCIKFLHIQGKLVFDGSIENLDCIIQHEEYKAITNKVENVAPLLRCKNGRSYSFFTFNYTIELLLKTVVLPCTFYV